MRQSPTGGVKCTSHLQIGERVEGGEVGDDDEEAGGGVDCEDSEPEAASEANRHLQGTSEEGNVEKRRMEWLLRREREEIVVKEGIGRREDKGEGMLERSEC